MTPRGRSITSSTSKRNFGNRSTARRLNPAYRLAVGREQRDGAVGDDELRVALVVLDAKLVVLDRVSGLGVAVGAAKVEEVVIEEREHVAGEVGRRDSCGRQPRSSPRRL